MGVTLRSNPQIFIGMSIWNWLLAALIVDEIIDDEDPQVQENRVNDYEEEDGYDYDDEEYDDYY